MSEPSETSGRPLASSTERAQQPESNIVHQPALTRTKDRKDRKTSKPSDDCSEQVKSTKSRRRSKDSKQVSPGPHTGSSRSEQRWTTSPGSMTSPLPPVHYTRTGRISKAKKGLKVHNCANCGRSYTRAEHLRRHQKNHAQDDALICNFPGCGKTFYREDLLQRHQERHNEPQKISGSPSAFSPESSPEATQVSTSTPGLVSSNIVATTLPSTPSYYPSLPVSPAPEAATISRYNLNPFRTPQLPRTPQASSSGFHYVIHSSPIPTTSPNQSKHRHSYAGGHSAAVAVPVAAGTTGFGGWSESYSQSPSYTSSSGYASPILGPGDYANLFALPPYGPGINRTRTSSNASFIEPWSYPSRSPTSTASTMAYNWSSSDKTPTAPGLAYMGTSYPMTSMPLSACIDSMTAYGPFGPRSMVQRDEEEGAFLFGEQPYGMGPAAHTYPFEQYLDYFWRLFHPTFPIVHRPTFERMNPSPMLHAAMIALGGQYSHDTSVKQNSRSLHDRCIKLLARRDQETLAEPDRLCDYQAMLLIEVHSQYRARRAARVLSSRFAKIYHKAEDESRRKAPHMTGLIVPLGQLNIVTPDRWVQWVEIVAWQHLLVACYILESQQMLLLAREPVPSLIQTGYDLPLPGHLSTWDAPNHTEWASATQRHPAQPKYVWEITTDNIFELLDVFQSSLLIATHYNSSRSSAPYIATPPDFEIGQSLNDSPVTMRQLLTANLVLVTPIRALLAVSGESWILSEKVPSAQAFASLRTILRTWLAQLWSSPSSEPHNPPVRRAIKLSVEILQQALKEQRDSVTLDVGTDMGIYFAALVLWAVTTAAETHIRGPQKAPEPSHHRHTPVPVFSSTISIETATSSTQPASNLRRQSVAQPITPPRQEPPRQEPPSTRSMLSHTQITINAISFLSTVSADLGEPAFSSQLPLNIVRCQTGCVSLLLWVKLRLRGVALGDQTSEADSWACKPHEGLGELLDGVTGSIERILSHGWNGWGI